MSGGALTGREWINDWKQRADKLQNDTQQMANRMGDLESTAYNKDDNIRVTVNSQGVVTDLKFKGSVRDMPAAQISADVLSTMRVAQKKILVAARDIIASTVGNTSETGKAVIASMEKQLRTS